MRMNKQIKILGKRGRVTIPLEVRQALGYKVDDILSFTPQPDGTLLIRREKLCNNCAGKKEPAEEKNAGESVMRLLDSLPDSQQKEILVKLTVRWAEREHYPLPTPGESNRSLYLDDFVPVEDKTIEVNFRGKKETVLIKGDIDRTAHTRRVMQEYIRTRGIIL